jgi:60 kDa SS-A/Ro ribonucleoprotein
MARLNFLNPNTRPVPRTHEGAPAAMLSAEAALRRTVLASLLWENQFYEDGVTVAERVAALVPQVEPAMVAALAIEARERMHLRHMPLLLVRGMARYASHRALVAPTLARVIQRADELAEFVAIYWKNGKQPLSAQVKKGLAAAFVKFDAYQLAKYDRAAPVRLRDVLFLCHARPLDVTQEVLWKQLAEGSLPTPDTWEVRLSAASDDADGLRSGVSIEAKRERWELLLREKRLGAIALLRNLRNMLQAGVDPELVRTALEEVRTDRVLPFRFVAAAREAPQWEEWIEHAMLASLAGQPALPGRTVLLVDVSGSMDARLSQRSAMQRLDAAAGVAVLLREVAEECAVYTFSERLVAVPARRGFALRDAIANSQPHSGTAMGKALAALASALCSSDRLIVLSDEQSRDRVAAPPCRGYMVNVAAYRNGVGYGQWIHIDGWSDAILQYIRELEANDAAEKAE